MTWNSNDTLVATLSLNIADVAKNTDNSPLKLQLLRSGCTPSGSTFSGAERSGPFRRCAGPVAPIPRGTTASALTHVVVLTF